MRLHKEYLLPGVEAEFEEEWRECEARLRRNPRMLQVYSFACAQIRCLLEHLPVATIRWYPPNCPPNVAQVHTDLSESVLKR